MPFDLIYKERVKQGNLRAAYDVIVIPNQGRRRRDWFTTSSRARQAAARLHQDRINSRTWGCTARPTTSPAAWASKAWSNSGNSWKPGGVLITLGTASAFPAEFGITRRVEAGRTSPQFYAPGPIVQAEILRPRESDLLRLHREDDSGALGEWSSADGAERDREQQVLMRFPGGDASVLSGLMRGANEIRGRPAVVDVPVGEGRVVMFATNPCYRWQNFGEFGMLFNAVMHYNDLKPRNDRWWVQDCAACSYRTRSATAFSPQLALRRDREPACGI